MGFCDVCSWSIQFSVNGFVIMFWNVTFINSMALSFPNLFLIFVMGLKVIFPLPCLSFTSHINHILCAKVCCLHYAVLSLGNYSWNAASHYLLKVMASSSPVFLDRWQLYWGPDTVRAQFNSYLVAAFFLTFVQRLIKKFFFRMIVLCYKWAAWDFTQWGIRFKGQNHYNFSFYLLSDLLCQSNESWIFLLSQIQLRPSNGIFFPLSRGRGKS